MSKVFGSDTYSAGNRTSDVGYIKNKEILCIFKCSTLQSSTVLALKISLWYICYNFCVENGIFNFSEIFKFINNGYIKVALPKQIAVKR